MAALGESALPRDTTPLYVDLDGTLTAADTTLEGFLDYAKTGVLAALRLTWWLLHGRVYVKERVADAMPIDVAALPYRPSVMALVEAARAQSRPVVLATASHLSTATRVAAHVGLFDRVIGTEGANLKGNAKLDAIRADCGDRPFDYVGDSGADVPIWAAARDSISVSAKPRTGTTTHIPIDRASTASALLRAMRPHQWAKNALVFVPLLTAWRVADSAAILAMVLAFVLFSLLASGVYLVNDALDIASDRAHPVKCKRPIASGALSLPLALGVAAALMTVPLLVGWLALGRAFGLALAVYLLTTTAYSFHLKRVMTMDVLTLAFLYTMRIVAGAAAIGVEASFWLTTLSAAIFTSLAYLKRYVELASLGVRGRNLSGRGYSADDTDIVAMSGLAAAAAAVLVMALFVNDPITRGHYQSPALLAGLFPILLYWLNRAWLMAKRGEMPSDPVAFAIKDPRSQILGLLALLVLFAARFIAV